MINQTNVIVMGGSLGGLSAALFLRTAGCHVTIFERAPAPLIGLGAGIVLNPATVRYFIQQGKPDVRQISVASHWVRYWGEQGQTLGEQYAPYRFSSYNALYQGLLAAFGLEHYHCGEMVTGFQQDAQGVTVQLASGRRVHGDLLVCADGIRSTARRRLLRNTHLTYAGYIAWRGVVSASDLAPATFAALRDAITYHLMPQSHILTYPIPVVDQGHAQTQPLINWLWYRNVSLGPALNTLMTDQQGIVHDVALSPGAVRAEHLAALRQAAAALPPSLAELIHRTAHPFIQAIMDCEPPRMAFGRVCLIGDAAFVARPHAAAGTAKAVEDGWQLSQALSACQGDIDAALQQWEPKQLALGHAVLQRTRVAGQRSQVESSWRVGDPLPFGLYTIGDSVME
ncbi:MAG: FAD-dependent monooxygenase [Caldilineaceae bacterium]